MGHQEMGHGAALHRGSRTDRRPTGRPAFAGISEILVTGRPRRARVPSMYLYQIYG